MQLLADENFPRRVVEYLRGTGHDVLWAGQDFTCTNDKDVLERAEVEGRILFTPVLVTPWGLDILPAGRYE